MEMGTSGKAKEAFQGPPISWADDGDTHRLEHPLLAATLLASEQLAAPSDQLLPSPASLPMLAPPPTQDPQTLSLSPPEDPKGQKLVAGCLVVVEDQPSRRQRLSCLSWVQS